MNECNFDTKQSRSEEDVIHFYDNYAKDWDARFGHLESTAYFLNQRWQMFEDILPPSSSDGVALELGVGTGVYIDRSSQLFSKIYALDGSPKMIEQLQEKLRAHGLTNVEAIQGSATALSMIQDESMDVVYFFGLLEHIIQTDDFVREIRRVLKPGGVVVGVTPNGLSPWYGLRKLLRGTGSHCTTDRHYTKSKVLELFEPQGFQNERVIFWGAVPAGVGHTLFHILKFAEKIVENSPLKMFLGGLTFMLRKV